MARRKKKHEEDTGLSPLIQQNIDYFRKHGHLTGAPWYEEEDSGHIPEGCRACGGDYPYCKMSCPLFDD